MYSLFGGALVQQSGGAFSLGGLFQGVTNLASKVQSGYAKVADVATKVQDSYDRLPPDLRQRMGGPTLPPPLVTSAEQQHCSTMIVDVPQEQKAAALQECLAMLEQYQRQQ